MLQRGRKSAASLSVVSLDSRRPARLQPSPDMTKDEAALFREVVASCRPEHFVPSDRPLLLAYVQAALASRRGASALMKDAGDKQNMIVFTRSTRVLAM